MLSLEGFPPKFEIRFVQFGNRSKVNEIEETRYSLAFSQKADRKALFLVNYGGNLGYNSSQCSIKILELTNLFLKSHTAEEFCSRVLGIPEDFLGESASTLIGPPIDIPKYSFEYEKKAVVKALLYWIVGRLPYCEFPEVPQELANKIKALTPSQRFCAFCTRRAYENIRKEENAGFLYWRFAPDITTEVLEKVQEDNPAVPEYFYFKRSKQYSVEFLPMDTMKPRRKIIAPDFHRPKNIKQEAEYTYYRANSAGLGYIYTSEWLLPLVWAEIGHCVKEDIPGQVCNVCGSVFVAGSPKQDYRQIYCSAECRRKADNAQDKEAQKLYKQFKSGKLTPKEYIEATKSKGVPVIGAKRGKLKGF